jgi:hypothetical protein
LISMPLPLFSFERSIIPGQIAAEQDGREDCAMTGVQPGKNRKAHACPACGSTVECGMANGDAACWCSALPHVLPVADSGDAQCYCQACLQALIRERSQRRVL